MEGEGSARSTRQYSGPRKMKVEKLGKGEALVNDNNVVVVMAKAMEWG